MITENRRRIYDGQTTEPINNAFIDYIDSDDKLYGPGGGTASDRDPPCNPY
jgi:hypothetical protein